MKPEIAHAPEELGGGILQCSSCSADNKTVEPCPCGFDTFCDVCYPLRPCCADVTLAAFVASIPSEDYMRDTGTPEAAYDDGYHDGAQDAQRDVNRTDALGGASDEHPMMLHYMQGYADAQSGIVRRNY